MRIPVTHRLVTSPPCLLPDVVTSYKGQIHLLLCNRQLGWYCYHPMLSCPHDTVLLVNLVGYSWTIALSCSSSQEEMPRPWSSLQQEANRGTLPPETQLPANPWHLTYCRKRTLLPTTLRICIESCIRQVDPATCSCSLHLLLIKSPSNHDLSNSTKHYGATSPPNTLV